MMRFLVYLFLFLLPTQLLGQAYGLSLPKGKKKLSIPFELFNNFIILKVNVNDQLNLKFILDSGASHTFLTQKRFLDSLGIEDPQKISIIGIDQNEVLTASIARNLNLEIHGLKGVFQSMVVLDKDIMKLDDFLGKKIHGVLGAAFFHRFVVKVNYDTRMLTLYEPDRFKAPRRYQKIPIQIEEDKSYFQALIMNEGRMYPLSFLIDTGASLGLLLHKKNAGVPLPENKIRGDIGRGLGGELKGWIGRLDRVAFSSFQFSGIITSFQNDTDLYFLDSTFRDGVVGGELLSRFDVILNYQQEMMYLRPSYTHNDPFEYDMSGLVVEPRDNSEDTYAVVRVIVGSPAEKADIRVGDEILNVNGSWRDLSVSKIYKALRSEEGRIIRMKIRRDGVVLKKSFKLRKLI